MILLVRATGTVAHHLVSGPSIPVFLSAAPMLGLWPRAGVVDPGDTEGNEAPPWRRC